MTERAVRALDAATPTGYLAALGLAALVPDSRVRFDRQGLPFISTDLVDDVVAKAVVDGIERFSAPEATPLPPTLQSTTPAWSGLARLARESWDDPVTDGLLRSFDVGSIKSTGKVPADPQVVSASLVLISGKSYLRKSIADLWPPAEKGANPDEVRSGQREAYEDDVAALLNEGQPRSEGGAMLLRLTTSEASPRLRRGTETAEVVPLIEGLALVGLIRLLPDQTDVNGRRGFTWAINDVPLDIRALVDIHESRSAPSSWVRFTARVRAIGGGTKASQFVDIVRVEDS